MEIVHTVEKRKKIIRNIGICFLFVILLLTFFSKTINNLLLPEVICESPTQRVLETGIETTGEVKILNTEKIYSYGAWKIKAVKVKSNSSIAKGDTLAIVDTDDIMLDLKQQELEIAKLENDILSYKKNFEGVDTSQYEDEANQALKKVKIEEENFNTVKALYEKGVESYNSLKDAQNKLDTAKDEYNKKLKTIEQKKAENSKNADEHAAEYELAVKQKRLEIEIKKLELEKYKKNIPVNGYIKSETNGIVKSALVERRTVCSSGQLLFEISPEDEKYCIEWKLDDKKAGALKVGDTVELKCDVPQKLNFKGIITDKQFITQDGVFKFISTTEIDKKELQEGMQIEVNAVKRSTTYPLVVSNSSVIKEGNNGTIYILKERKGVLGEEKYVQKITVTIQDSDDSYSAINGSLNPDDEVIVYSTKVLEDGMQVKLK